ncbi:glycosyltransferase [Streptomyces morookaense]|uniref:Glycosyltransferase n=1 Tax=Streptomyces morookaense TaxID=1970 RepID=A0A7Y7E6Z8_STRMO|nr:glycosyltransferase [Streptomyces morookaense]NVK77702.1 glycosyltransferase [Streptomyces morookaense]GHF05152.1 GDP-mannose-dependent alpha-(1-6)-phosphatidylinositol dimannoside mannosyltransferase [Streptomyces morookaense]
MRIVQIANFYGASSGGLRTTLDALGRGYAAAGHERVLVVPGRRYAAVRSRADGLRVTLPGLPVGGGYRMMVSPRTLRRLLLRLAPDSLEVSDKLTLVHTAAWARARGVRSVLFSHERADAILAPRLPGWVPLAPLADGWNRRLAAGFDAVVAASAFSCAEFARVDAPAVHRVPLGVDLRVFAPPRAGAGVGAAQRAGVRLVFAGRLSAEKSPALPLETLRVLRRRGVDARLDVLGDGPERARLQRRAAGLPVRFHGHVADRGAVAGLLARADVALVPCPVEAFGLAALEALACGTPVVVADAGAARELLAPGAGLAVGDSPGAVAEGVRTVLGWPEPVRRAAARRRAEEFPWARTVAGMLRVHAGGAP